MSVKCVQNVLYAQGATNAVRRRIDTADERTADRRATFNKRVHYGYCEYAKTKSSSCNAGARTNNRRVCATSIT
jgi:hypothetical protein